MASARQHGSDDQGDRARTCRRRRSHLPLGAEKILSQTPGRARQGRNAVLLHHAGADCGDRSVQTDRRLYRQRADAVRAQRMGSRRQGGVRTVCRLCAAPGAEFLALRRQAHAGRAHRVDRDAGPRHRLGRASERRSGLVGNPDGRPRAGAEEEPQRHGRHRRSARQHRQLPHEPLASALQRRARAPRDPHGDEPGRLHARGRG